MIYATDLDRTIIFSNKFLDDCDEEVVCVEEKNDTTISYMTVSSLNKLEKLKAESNLNVIPTTTRSVVQFQRVRPFQDCKFAITSNGGTILYNGKVFLPWYNYIQRVLSGYVNDFKIIPEQLKVYSDYFDKPLKIVDNMFFYGKLKSNTEKNEELLSILNIELNKAKWSFTLQGLKLYIIPKEISKENAILYLKRYLNDDCLIVSGDGKLDLNFLSVGDIRIIPDGSEVLSSLPDSSFVYKSVPKGLKGTYDLLNIVEQNL